MATVTELITAEQFESMTDIDRAELIYGEIVEMSSNKSVHGFVEGKLVFELNLYCREAKCGIIMSGDNCFVLQRDPDLVRCPDVSYVRNERIPSPFPTGFFPGPPDIAVEVVSPSDRVSDVNAKIEQWLRAGTVAVWIADPQSKTSSIHALENDKVVGRQVDSFAHEELLPGFELPAIKLFELPT